MKEEKSMKLSCERARAFPIEKALAKLGHFPTRTGDKEAWFLSPFRSEDQASFKVCKRINRWYDHGEGKGGNVIDLVCLITNSSVSEALVILDDEQISFSFQKRPILKGEQNKSRIRITQIKELTHIALMNYLKSRGIVLSTALGYVSEVHYSFKGKKYFAIGLKNGSGGWELRNGYMKNSSSPKDISLIKNGTKKLIVTEGMFALLSLLTYNERLELENDFLVLNSTAFVLKGLKIIEYYNQVKLYLDNDKNGKRTTQRFMEHCSNCEDRSNLYSGFKDMNEWLMASTKVTNGQTIQDVSLLPQRQSCFAPDGRKVNKK